MKQYETTFVVHRHRFGLGDFFQRHGFMEVFTKAMPKIAKKLREGSFVLRVNVAPKERWKGAGCHPQKHQAYIATFDLNDSTPLECDGVVSLSNLLLLRTAGTKVVHFRSLVSYRRAMKVAFCHVLVLQVILECRKSVFLNQSIPLIAVPPYHYMYPIFAVQHS